MFSSPVSSTQGSRSSSPSWARASPKSPAEMGSERGATTSATTAKAVRKPAMQLRTVWAAAAWLPKA